MTSQHSVAYFDAVKKPIRFESTETPKPGSGELLVKNKAIAINPVDWSMQENGIFVQKWPTVAGQDIAGEVVAVGDGVKRFSVGQGILAHCQALLIGDLRQAGFQEYSIIQEGCAVALPDSVSFEQGSVLPLSVSTAASGLFPKRFLGLPYPSTSPQQSDKSLLVWGGSSSVGLSTIQLAVAAGLKVVTTCSSRNQKLCESLGAKAFDYNSPSIVGDLVAELQKGSFAGAYDAIGTRESEMQTAQVVASFGGGKIASVLPPPEDIPATVNSSMILAPEIFTKDAEVGKAIWEDFLPNALSSGQFLAKPDPEVVGTDLEALQRALDAQKKGVSAKKIVITL